MTGRLKDAFAYATLTVATLFVVGYVADLVIWRAAQ